MLRIVRNILLLSAVFVAVTLIVSAQSSPVHMHSRTVATQTSFDTAKLLAVDASTQGEASLRKPCNSQSDTGCDLAGGSICPLGCGVLHSSEHALATLARLGTSPSISPRLDSTHDGAHFRPPISVS